MNDHSTSVLLRSQFEPHCCLIGKIFKSSISLIEQRTFEHSGNSNNSRTAREHARQPKVHTLCSSSRKFELRKKMISRKSNIELNFIADQFFNTKLTLVQNLDFTCSILNMTIKFFSRAKIGSFIIFLYIALILFPKNSKTRAIWC